MLFSLNNIPSALSMPILIGTTLLAVVIWFPLALINFVNKRNETIQIPSALLVIGSISILYTSALLLLGTHPAWIFNNERTDNFFITILCLIAPVIPLNLMVWFVTKKTSPFSIPGPYLWPVGLTILPSLCLLSFFIYITVTSEENLWPTTILACFLPLLLLNIAVALIVFFIKKRRGTKPD